MNWLDSIKNIKKEKGLTNEALAEKSNISLGTLNKLLAGQTEDPKLSTLLDLANGLDCTLDEMLGRTSTTKLSLDETMKKYYRLDKEGKEIVDMIINREYEKIDIVNEGTANKRSIREIIDEKIRIKLFDIGASAGTGSYLFDDSYKMITIKKTPKTESADFAIKVSGSSMLPKFKNGDIILVSKDTQVQIGDIGVFSIDGESYVKQYGGNELISLNKEYSNIPLSKEQNITCFGKVIATLKS